MLLISLGFGDFSLYYMYLVLCKYIVAYKTYANVNVLGCKNICVCISIFLTGSYLLFSCCFRISDFLNAWYLSAKLSTCGMETKCQTSFVAGGLSHHLGCFLGHEDGSGEG